MVKNTEKSMLFETSWEVCNKVGGIYTVLSTKAKELGKVFGDRLVFIGPDIWDDQNPSPDFKERKTLLKYAASRLKLPYGIEIRIGRWDIPGSPIVVLVKFKSIEPELDRFFGEMWQSFGVDSLHAYGDYRESCAFAIASAITVKNLSQHLKISPQAVTAHFDEWTTGMGLLYLKKYMPEAATIFTTHATSIGRSICGNGKPLYDYFTAYNGDQMAQELNMESKHSLEKTAAAQADCFTTVSEVTARECLQLLGRKPDIVTPNGFEPNFIPGSDKALLLRRNGRSKLIKIVSLLTGQEWPDETFIVATSGRNEFRNKGIDLFIDAIDHLRRSSQTKNIIALILVPAWVSQPSGELLVDMEGNGDIRPKPDWATHHLNNEDSDPIFLRIGQLESQNCSCKVKTVFIPCYLDGHDGIVNISYYDLLPALDLTVFPSYYEPWGYTPLESIAFGVPTVSSDKAGFGQWILSLSLSPASSGVEVISRTDSNYQDDILSISNIIKSRARMSASEAQAMRKAAANTAKAADWKFFLPKYIDAFEIAHTARDRRIARTLAGK